MQTWSSNWQTLPQVVVKWLFHGPLCVYVMCLKHTCAHTHAWRGILIEVCAPVIGRLKADYMLRLQINARLLMIMWGTRRRHRIARDICHSMGGVTDILYPIRAGYISFFESTINYLTLSGSKGIAEFCNRSSGLLCLPIFNVIEFRFSLSITHTHTHTVEYTALLSA